MGGRKSWLGPPSPRLEGRVLEMVISLSSKLELPTSVSSGLGVSGLGGGSTTAGLKGLVVVARALAAEAATGDVVVGGGGGDRSSDMVVPMTGETASGDELTIMY